MSWMSGSLYSTDTLMGIARHFWHQERKNFTEGCDGEEPRRASRPDLLLTKVNPDQILICLTVGIQDSEDTIQRMAERCRSLGATLLWVDGLDKSRVLMLAEALAHLGYRTQAKPICGRSLGDQVWWKRWVATGQWGYTATQPFCWVTADDEPCTPPLFSYPMEWWVEDGDVGEERWESGTLKLDSTMPYLGATKPKPAGHLIRPTEGKALVWDPKRPLPGLHEGSWDCKRKDRLLLLGKGPDGPAARTLFAEEASQLWGRKGSSLDPETESSEILQTPPRSLTELSVKWAAHQCTQKVGVCR